MSLRILHIDTGRDWRGGQRQVLLLARGLRQLGLEPLVMAQAGAPLVRRLRADGLAAAALRARADWDLAAAMRIRRVVRAWRPDVVHAHDARAHALALAALIGNREVPLVVTRRVAFLPRGRVKYGRRVGRFIAISNAVRSALIAGGVDEERIDVVYSGVPEPRVEVPRDWRRELGWPAGCLLCGVVGAMTGEKGLRSLEAVLEALSPASRQAIRVVFLGGRETGPAELAGIAGYRAGFVEGIHEAMAGLDLLLHPSSAEGLGTAVIDAMALRVPPVAFAVGGLVEVVEDRVSGRLAPAGNSHAFARILDELATDTLTRSLLAEAGPARAALFSVGRMVEGTVAVYRHVLAAGPKRRPVPGPS